MDAINFENQTSPAPINSKDATASCLFYVNDPWRAIACGDHVEVDRFVLSGTVTNVYPQHLTVLVKDKNDGVEHLMHVKYVRLIKGCQLEFPKPAAEPYTHQTWLLELINLRRKISDHRELMPKVGKCIDLPDTANFLRDAVAILLEAEKTYQRSIKADKKKSNAEREAEKVKVAAENRKKQVEAVKKAETKEQMVDMVDTVYAPGRNQGKNTCFTASTPRHLNLILERQLTSAVECRPTFENVAKAAEECARLRAENDKLKELAEEYRWIPLTERQPLFAYRQRHIQILMNINCNPYQYFYWLEDGFTLPSMTTHWREVPKVSYQKLGYVA